MILLMVRLFFLLIYIYIRTKTYRHLPRQKIHTSISDAQYVNTEQQQNKDKRQKWWSHIHIKENVCISYSFACVHKRLRYNYRARSWKRKLQDKICKKKKKSKQTNNHLLWQTNENAGEQNKKLITFVWPNMRKQRDEINRQPQRTVACA
jgi:hypothetical protein